MTFKDIRKIILNSDVSTTESCYLFASIS